MKIGMELEFWVVDKEGRLAPAKPVSERVYFTSQEFSRSMIEIQTEPHEDLEELFREAISKTEMLSELAKKDGRRIVPLGTPLNSGEVEVHESRRFMLEKQVIGPEVKHAGRTAGLHIHFEKENVKDQLNSLTALDPALAAMNSSPYFNGHPVASDSRNQIYRYRACGPFPEQRQLWEFIDSVEDWKEKRREIFRRFEEEAERKGVSNEELGKHFTPENATWNPVKLREDYPTVEWRAPDISMMTEIIKLVKQLAPLVRENRLKDRTPDFAETEEASQKAIKQGLESEQVRDYLESLGFDHTGFSPLSERLSEKDHITRKKARKIRRDTAEKLDRDLEDAKDIL